MAGFALGLLTPGLGVLNSPDILVNWDHHEAAGLSPVRPASLPWPQGVKVKGGAILSERVAVGAGGLGREGLLEELAHFPGTLTGS